jgi:hypothetical protein
VEICADRPCTKIETTFDSPGSSGAAPSNIKPGVHFVRLGGRVGPTVGGARSATWEFLVPHRSAPRKTSYGAFPDFNGDGVAEVIAAGGTVAVDVFPGDPLGPANGSVLHVTDPSHDASDNFPRPVFGDVDGDGFSDLVVGNVTSKAYPADSGNRVSIYRGGSGGLVSLTTPSWVIHVPTQADGGTTASGFGSNVSIPGDLNGDGYADILVGATDAGSVVGVVYAYFGHATGPSTTPDFMLHGNSADTLPYYFYPSGPIGDVNGDGFTDVLCSTAAGYGAWLFLGSATGPSDATRHRVTTPVDALTGNFSNVMNGAGDLDGDGLPDFVIGANFAPNEGGAGPGYAYVFKGDTSVTGLLGADLRLVGPDADGSNFGAAGAIVGDLDGDGYDDLEIGAYAAAAGAGRAYYFRGSATGVSEATRVTITGTGSGFATGAQAGDLNGDGIVDTIIAQPGAGVLNVYMGVLGVGINNASVPTQINSAPFIYIFAGRGARQLWTSPG